MTLSISERRSQLLDRIAAAAQRCDRDPSSITLLAASKAQSTEKIRQAMTSGQMVFGENYLQEALDKMSEISDTALAWHYIGNVQTNKCKSIAAHFDWVQGVSRIKEAERLSKQRSEKLSPLNLCIEVNIDAVENKGGVLSEELVPLAQAISELPNVRLRGLMAIPEPRDTHEAQRDIFCRVADLLYQLNDRGFECDTLSMGMSHDFEAAIEAGSTMVRIGTALFGERHRHPAA